VNDVANVGPCISRCQYAPLGSTNSRNHIEVKKGAFTCSLDAALFVLGGKWKPLILFHLAHGTGRYGELRSEVGKVSDKVLIRQFKESQADGIIDRVDFGDTSEGRIFPHGFRENVGKGAGAAL
jgi:hypothetical protein